MGEKLKSAITFPTVLMLVIGVVCEESWRESRSTHDDVVTIKASIPYMQADISTLKNKCVDMTQVQLAIETSTRRFQKQVNIQPLTSPHNQE